MFGHGLPLRLVAESATTPRRRGRKHASRRHLPLFDRVEDRTLLATNFGLNFAAATPGTYDQSTGTGGQFGDGSGTYTVESLDFKKETFRCGDHVIFFLKVTDTNPVGTVDTLNVTLQTLADSTGQSGVALKPVDLAGGGPAVTLNTPDSGNSFSVANTPVVASTASTLTGAEWSGGTGSYYTEYAQVSNLHGGDSVILRLDTVIDCNDGAHPTGNLQANLQTAALASGASVSSGAQTVPLKNVQNILPPGAGNDSFTCVDVDQPFVMDASASGLLGNDSDPNGGLHITSVTSPSALGGAVVLNTSSTPPTVTYTAPNPSTLPVGSVVDSFQYTATDSQGLTETSTVTLALNRDPTTPGSSSLGVVAPGSPSSSISPFASDMDNDVLTITVNGAATPISQSTTTSVAVPGGSLAITPSTDPVTGLITYAAAFTPDGTVHGPETISYSISDECGSVNGSIGVTIDTAPTAANGSLACVDVTAGSPAASATGSVTVGDADNDNLTLSLVGAGTNQDGGPAYGSLQFTNNPVTVTGGTGAGNYSYTLTALPAGAPTGKHLADTFTYKANDGYQDSGTATIVVTLDRAPVAGNAALGTILPGHSATTGSLVSDPDADNVSLSSTLDPSVGTLVLNTDGSLTFTAAAGAHGSYTINYTVTDSKNGDGSANPNGCLTAGGQLTVTVNTPPTATPGSLACVDAGSTTGAVTGGDADGDPLTFSVTTAPTIGSVVMAANGSFTYTVTAAQLASLPTGSHPVDTFQFEAYDGIQYSAPASVTLTLDRAPVAPSSGTTVVMNSPTGVSGNVLTNVTDPDADYTSISTYTSPPASSGTFTFNSTTGAWSFVPASNFSGTVSFTYTVTDSKNGDGSANPNGCLTATGTVTITVTSAARTQGYWKTHETSTSSGGYWTLNNGSHVTSLTIGGSTYTPDQVVAIMNMSAGTGTSANAILILWDQLVAAKLNVLNGVYASPADLQAINNGDALIIQAAGPRTSTKLAGNKKGQLVWMADSTQAYVAVSDPTLGQPMVYDANILNTYNSSGV